MLKKVRAVGKLYTVNSIESRETKEFFRSKWERCKFDWFLREYSKAIKFMITSKDFPLHFKLTLNGILVAGYIFQK